MSRSVLIVDDIKSNRDILRNILGDEYEVLEAADGRAALEIMEREADVLSAVLLDLGMPVMDGYEVLRAMQDAPALAQLPVIVTTGQTDADSEERALLLGAKDYISKPYQPPIIRQRIRNTVKLRETAATVNALQRDRLTGLYNREAFFGRVAVMAAAAPAGSYVMACFDIDSFKMINDQYGTAVGDDVLRCVARVFSEGFEKRGGICCRMMADNFAVFYPVSMLGTPALSEMRAAACAADGLVPPISISVGRYRVTDLSLTPSAMYDRASLASLSIKGRYDMSVAEYDESMRDSLLLEQQIVTEMAGALAAGQFEAWYQPQYNHSTGVLTGAEALARWRHPQRGLIPPCEFIPIFEKNGFVYELDKYIWEQACAGLARRIATGRHALPVSVNISRYDVFRPGMAQLLSDLTEEYNIPVSLLRLEITESAFAESSRKVVEVVKDLVARGFTVEIDDFGSGYSSLNILKSVPAQALKLDMRFLEDDDDSRRGGNILESVVRMAKWLGMSIIAEGVEEKDQADFLRSIGCDHVQGYLYARPMPPDEYDVLCSRQTPCPRPAAAEKTGNIDNNAFWDPKSMDTLIFNSYVGGACIYEYHNGSIELLRATQKYAQVIGSAGMTVEDALSLDWSNHLDADNAARVLADLDRSVATGDEVTGEYVFTDLPGCPHETYLRSSMRVIASVDDRHLVFCTNENMTAQRMAERRERQTMNRLQTVMDSVGCGIIAVVPDGDRTQLLLTNDAFYNILGYTEAQYRAIDPYTVIHPSDRAQVRRAVRGCCDSGRTVTLEYRVLRGDGETGWVRCVMSMTAFDGVDRPVQVSIFTDITSQRLAAQELLDNLPCGAALYELEDGELKIQHINKRYWEMVDRAPVELTEQAIPSSIHPDDLPVMRKAIADSLETGRDIVCDLRTRYGADGYRVFHVIARVTPRRAGVYSVYATFAPVSDAAAAFSQMLPVALETMMASRDDMTFVKDIDLRYVCCSRETWKAAGVGSEAEMRGKTASELFPPAIAEKIRAVDLELIASGQSKLNIVERIPAGDGGVRYISLSRFPLKDDRGRTIGVYGTGGDVTESRMMRTQLELLINNISGGVGVYEGSAKDPERLKLTYFNDGFCRLFGYTRAEYAVRAGNDPLGSVFEEDRHVILEQLTCLVKKGTPMDCICRVHSGDDGCKWINVRGRMGAADGDSFTVDTVLFDVTEHQKALERLRISEEENRLAVRHGGSIVCRYHISTARMTVPAGVSASFDLPGPDEEVPGSLVADGRVSSDTAAAFADFFESVRNGEPDGEGLFRLHGETGWRWVRARYTTIFADAGTPVTAVISLADETESLARDAAYKKWRQSLSDKDPAAYTLLRCNLNSRTVFDDRLGGLLRTELPAGSFDFDTYAAGYAHSAVSEQDRDRFVAFVSINSLMAGFYRGRHTVSLEYRELVEAAGERWLRLTVELVENPLSSGVEAYLLFENIDAARREQLCALERAQTDPLTGVLNRAAFIAQADARLHGVTDASRCALLMLDLDGFKQVNDSFGHSVGDSALIETARRLRGALRQDDLVGRLGGDEFVVLLAGIPGDAAAANKAKQICGLVRRAYSLNVAISGSVGIAVAPRDGCDFESLYRKADSALYYVKGSGKDAFAFFRTDMEEARQPAAPCTAVVPLKKRRMLIVDDNRVDFEMLSKIFADDYTVDRAGDGAGALVRLRHYGQAVSVVLLDLIMPGMDGFGVLEQMRRNEALRLIPVVVVSGDESSDTGLRAIRAGAADFVSKPVDPQLLRIRVESAVSRAENERLRTRNSMLEYQNSQVSRYRTVLERSGVVVIEHDWITGEFIYDLTVSEHLAGNYNKRDLWHILLSDFVGDTQTVRRMQQLVHGVATDKNGAEDSALVRLRTPSGEKHWFRIKVFRILNEYGLTSRVYITLTDLGTGRPEGMDA